MMKKRILGMIVALANVFAASAESVYTIYPVPHEQVAVEGVVRFTDEVNVVAESAIDQSTKERLTGIFQEHGIAVTFSEGAVAEKANVFLGVNGSGESVDALAGEWGLDRSVFSKDKYDRHILSLQSDASGCAKLLVLGENTDAVFIGLASLEQMLDGGHESMRCVTINDYADQMYRGLVEGYYGYPYSVTMKKNLMRFMMRNKMNTYIYGPKGDPYHAGYWRQAYPETVTAAQAKNGWLSQDMLRDLTEESHKTKVNFVWAVHPGNDFIGRSDVVSDILKKFDLMYDLGVRQFAIFVDDVSVPSSLEDLKTNAERLTEVQRGIEAAYNTADALPADTVKPIHFVGQIYASSFSGADVRKNYFGELAKVPENVTIYTTGWGVWSVPNASDINVVKDDLGRDVAWWWNYPCNDNADSQVFVMDMYSNFYDMPSVSSSSRLPAVLPGCNAVISNPMQEGAVSKISLFSVADYAWNNAAFNNEQSWNASFRTVASEEFIEDLQLLAPYLRYNDPSQLKSDISDFKRTISSATPSTSALKQNLQNVHEACVRLARLKDSSEESDTLLYADLRPFLQKLTDMTHDVLSFLNAVDAEDKETMWTSYVKGVETSGMLETNPAYNVPALEGMGTGASEYVHHAKVSHNYLTPFVVYMREHSVAKHFDVESTGELSAFSSTGFASVRARSSSETYYLNSSSAAPLGKGDYLGMELPFAMKPELVEISDTLLSNWKVCYSGDGKNWIDFLQGEKPANAIKYVCIMNTADDVRTLKVSKAAFSITFPAKAKIVSAEVPGSTFHGGTSAAALYDGDISTSCILNRNMETGDTYTLTFSKLSKLTDVSLYFETTNGDYPDKTKLEVSEDGTTWSALRTKDTRVTEFGYSDGTPLENNRLRFDFKGKIGEYKYLRLVVVEKPSANKWFRIAEVEVNKDFDLTYGFPICADGVGNSLPNLYDALPYTRNEQSQAVGNAIVYNIQGLKPSKELIVYHGETEGDAVAVSVTEDGTNWREIGTLVGAITRVDLSAQPDVKSMRLSWNGEAPMIYEIQNVIDEDAAPTLTAIESVEQIQGTLHVELQSGVLMALSEKPMRSVSLCTLDGRILATISTSGTSAQLPRVAKGEPVIVAVTFADNTKSVTKVAVR